jgi:predicted Rossmann fold nucleotide-binding protein DprA/Smf involved in DNA uptake
MQDCSDIERWEFRLSMNKSGALITARYALDQGREVFIGPYTETDERAFGNHRLARDGAKTAVSHEDVIAEFANLFALDATYRAKRPHFTAAVKAEAEAPSPEEGLSEREKEIYRAKGESNKILGVRKNIMTE